MNERMGEWGTIKLILTDIKERTRKYAVL